MPRLVDGFTLIIVTTSKTNSSTSFDSDMVDVPSRPTTTITIGDHAYPARAPKMQVWMNTAFLLERLEKAREAQDRLDSGDPIPVAERKELQAELSLAPSPQEFHEAMIDGRAENGRILGGFLRRCLSAEDYAKLAADLDDEDSELDLPDLYQAAFELLSEFEPWFVQRAETMNLASPKSSRTAKAKGKGKSGSTRRVASR